MRGILWHEMYNAKKNDEYIVVYIALLKTSKKFFELSILLLTSTGFIVWLSSKNTSIFIGLSTGLAAFLKILELIQDKIVASDEYIKDVIDLRFKWMTYYDNISKIWLNLEHERINNDEASRQFEKLRSKKRDIEIDDSNIKIWQIFFLNNKADLRTNKHMEQYYG